MSEIENKESSFVGMKERLKTMKDWDKKTWLFVILFMLIVAATLALYVMIVNDQELLFRIVVNFVKWVLDFPIEWLIPVLFIVFMGIQGLLMPIPSEMVLLMAGAMWGLRGGFVAGMIGSLFAAVLCYWIAAKGGGPMVEKFFGSENIDALDVYLQKSGTPIVFILRAFPLMSFDIVSYVSGLIKLDFKKYFLANLFGCITRALFWAWLGNTMIYDSEAIYSICAGLPAGLTDQALLLAMPDECLEAYISQKAGNFNVWIVILVAITVAFMLLYNYVIIPKLKERRKKELAAMSEEDRKKILEAEASVKATAEMSANKTLEIEEY